jgi:FkbM family methyltransferase
MRTMRDRIAAGLTQCARRIATEAGWGFLGRTLGIPDMRSGLLALRERGVPVTAVVDCGACVGQWTDLLRSVYPEASILMIEPQTRHAQALNEVCRRHGNGVRVINTLVGAREASDVPFVVLDDGLGTGSSVLAENSDVPRHVEKRDMSTLDIVVREAGFPAPDFVKLDVQGYEIEVLRGAQRVLEGASFVLLEVSVWQYNHGSPLISDVLEWMKKRGFVTYDVFDLSRREDGVLVQMDLLFIREDSVLLNDKTTRFGLRADA